MKAAAGATGSADPSVDTPPGHPTWHSLPVAEVLRRLESSPDGLDADEARRRMERYGPNRLTRAAKVSALSILASQFKSLVVLLLVAAALVALVLGDTLEAVAIGVVLAINTLIGFFVELRARRAMDALLRYEVPTAKVVRGGQVEQIAADRLVPGDVIALEEGDRVPADARLIEAVELRTNEAPLTGESLPVDKSSPAVPEPEALLAERTSMLYSGTAVFVGRARAVVVGTGAETEIGRIGALVAQVEEGRTPLEVRLDALGRRLVWLTLGVAGVVTGLGVVQGSPLGRMIETGIALAIAAVPEGLPAVATIALAVGLRRMARRNAIVRRLSAVETLGATTVVCTDKTGTLTAGQMTATVVAAPGRRLEVTGTGYAPEGEFLGSSGVETAAASPWLERVLVAAALTSRAQLMPEGDGIVGDPTDAALTVLALKGGVDADELLETLPLERDVPFSSQRRASASIHRKGEGLVVFVKGAPATILHRCARWAADDVERELDEASRAGIIQDNEALAAKGLRVIALASGSSDRLEDLVFLALAGIVDPPAEGVRETIDILRTAGIRTVMITGDQRATAETIAQEVGALESGQQSVDGRELDRLGDEQMTQQEGAIGVFSRVSPKQKLRIVGVLQASGEIVAMLGDGVNDAAALKKADIGVAMGVRGTDVARQTADIVLQDDRFLTIGAAVEEGRVIYENIRKFVFYLFSCNLAEVFVLLLASIAGLPQPLLPLQILWLNLVTDTFPALALALEPAEPDVMRRPPRDPDEAILSPRFVKAMTWYAGLITLATLAAYLWSLQSGSPERAVTVAFMTLALAQLFHLGNARSRSSVLSWRRITANPWAFGAVPLVIALQLAAVYWPPLAAVLRTVPLSPGDWLVVMGLSVVPAVVGQVGELVQERRAAEPPSGARLKNPPR
jgi:Ca2+-transporting ATPase